MDYLALPITAMKRLIRNSPTVYSVILGITVLVLIIIAAYKSIMTSLNVHTPIMLDSAGHHLIALHYLNQAKQSITGIITSYPSHYPPLEFILFTPFLSFFGPTRIAAVIFNLEYMILTAVIAFLIIRKKNTFFTSLYFFLIIFLALFNNSLTLYESTPWHFMLVIPLACSVVITLFAFTYFESKSHLSKIDAILLAAMVSAAILTKWEALIYIAIPLIRLYLTLAKKKAIGTQVTITFIVSMAVFNSWYIYNAPRLAKDLLYYATTMGLKEQNPQGFAAIQFYLTALLETFAWFVPLFFVLLILILWNKKNNLPRPNTKSVNARYVLISILSSFLLLIIVPNNDERYSYTLSVLLIIYLGIIATQKLSTRLLFLFGCIVSIVGFVTITFFFPNPDTNLYAMTHLQTVIQEHPDKLRYYFCENLDYTFRRQAIQVVDTRAEYKNFLNKMCISYEDNYEVATSAECAFPWRPFQLITFRSRENDPSTLRISMADFCTNSRDISCETPKVYRADGQFLEVSTCVRTPPSP